MHGLRHPLTHALYDARSDGTVVVTATDGRTGTFDSSGRWIDGDLRHADALLCRWVMAKAHASRSTPAAPPRAGSTSGGSNR
jgi:hypothetical protein